MFNSARCIWITCSVARQNSFSLLAARCWARVLCYSSVSWVMILLGFTVATSFLFCLGPVTSSYGSNVDNTNTVSGQGSIGFSHHLSSKSLLSPASSGRATTATHSTSQNTTMEGGIVIPHSVDSGQTYFQTIFNCQICFGVHFPSKFDLGKHLKDKHSSVYMSVCVQCGKGFKSLSGASHHDRLYHQDKSDLDQCKICGKYFTCASLLRIHERRHSNTRDFLCTECGKSYKHKKNLQSHVCTSDIQVSKDWRAITMDWGANIACSMLWHL